MLCLWNPRPQCWNKARPLPSWCFIAPSYVCFTLWRRRNSRWHGFSSLRRASRSTRSDRIGATSTPRQIQECHCHRVRNASCSGDHEHWQV